MRSYRNLTEINNDLQLMKLRVQLEREKIRMDVMQLKRATRPQNLVQNLVAQSLKNVSVISIIKGLLKKRR